MQTNALVRKQFFISADNVVKLERLAKQFKGSSAAKIVRDAIDAYNPNGQAEDQKELMALAHSKVKEAIKATDSANEKMDICLETLSKTGGV